MTLIVEAREGEDGDHNSKIDDKKPPQLVVECYDPSTPSFKFVREVYLYKNEEYEPFIKKENTADFIRNCSFATNGQTLLLQTS